MVEETRDHEVEEKDDRRYRDKGYVTLYSNFAQIGITPWDIQVTFSQLAEHEIDKTGVMDLATVIMTPLMAKVLTLVLRENVVRYEKQHGEIVVPAGVIKKGSESESPSASPSASSSASTSPSASASPSPENEDED